MASPSAIEHAEFAALVAQAGRDGLPLADMQALLAAQARIMERRQIGHIVDDARQFSRARFAQ